MKRTLLILTLCLALLTLTACKSSEQQHFDYSTDVPTQGGSNVDLQVPTTEVPNYDDGTYDPASEEGLGAEDPSAQIMGSIAAPMTMTDTPAPVMDSQYAGATPVVIDPIDKPTPTPVPPLTFAYQVYDATNLGLSFEGPVGWAVDATASDTYILYNPDPAMSYTATVTLRATPVNTDYDASALTTAIKDMLNTIGASGFKEFDPSNTASRTLLSYAGVYANYTGTLTDGTEVAGRVHATCVNRVLYTLHITYPRAYTETYKEGVYDKLRHTIKFTQ